MLKVQDRNLIFTGKLMNIHKPSPSIGWRLIHGLILDCQSQWVASGQMEVCSISYRKIHTMPKIVTKKRKKRKEIEVPLSKKEFQSNKSILCLWRGRRVCFRMVSLLLGFFLHVCMLFSLMFCPANFRQLLQLF